MHTAGRYPTFSSPPTNSPKFKAVPMHLQLNVVNGRAGSPNHGAGRIYMPHAEPTRSPVSNLTCYA
jgi:hypothetical protein